MGKPLYVVYMDLKNAFPSTDRPTLWIKLHEMGFRGVMIDWVKMVYNHMRYIIKLRGEFSHTFEAFLGLLTGDPTSPGFWNIFLADFKVTVHLDDVCLNGRPVPKLEHADDIALASTTSSPM
jgi:Reverse transcriptase (RNA-dependent DNA polymerase)